MFKHANSSFQHEPTYESQGLISSRKRTNSSGVYKKRWHYLRLGAAKKLRSNHQRRLPLSARETAPTTKPLTRWWRSTTRARRRQPWIRVWNTCASLKLRYQSLRSQSQRSLSLLSQRRLIQTHANGIEGASTNQTTLKIHLLPSSKSLLKKRRTHSRG